jgi:hypothetical protein
VNTGELDFIALEVRQQLGDRFGPDTLKDQTVFRLIESGGDLVKAFRRWQGWDTEFSAFEDVQHHAAHVVFSAFVTASAFGRRVAPVKWDLESRVDDTTIRLVSFVAGSIDAIRATHQSDIDTPQSLFISEYLRGVVESIVVLAHRLGFDLQTAVDNLAREVMHDVKYGRVAL